MASHDEEDAMVTEIGLHDLEQALEAGALLLDVRESDEYAEGHIPGAQLLPLSVLPVCLHELPRDRPVLVEEDIFVGHDLSSSRLSYPVDVNGTRA